MFSVFDRGRRRPHPPFICVPEEPLRPDHARLAAWAAVLGQEPSPERRPHRGQLPDVDWSPMERVPASSGPFARLLSLFRRKGADRGLSAGSPVPLAEVASPPYLGEADSTAAEPAADTDNRRAA